MGVTIEEQYENAIPWSDGDIFLKIRFYQTVHKDELMEGKWWARLSPSKQRGLRQVLAHHELRGAFDRLIVFPGLWRGLTLGNFQRLLTVKCDEGSLQALDLTFR